MAKDKQEKKDCPKCNGVGEVWLGNRRFVCTSCNGTGTK